jgi:Lrp/AsnC family transcriptional regulator for asnA, asnC and gidA
MTNAKQFLLDELDVSILRHLEEDGRKSYSDIAEDLGVAVSTVSARMSKLIDRNVLSILAFINPFEVGLDAPALIMMNIEPRHFEEAVEEILEYPEVNFASMTSGEYNLNLDVFCRDSNHLTELITQRLYKVIGVQDLNVTYQLRRLKLRPTGVDVLQPETIESVD